MMLPSRLHPWSRAVLEWTSAQPDSDSVVFPHFYLDLNAFIWFQSWSGSWLDLTRSRPRSSQTRKLHFWRFSPGRIFYSLRKMVEGSRNMFAFFLLIAAAGAQDYCAITPKHTACGQKVGSTRIITYNSKQWPNYNIDYRENLHRMLESWIYLRDYLAACWQEGGSWLIAPKSL